MAVQKSGGLFDQRQQFAEGKLRKVQRGGDAAGIDPGFFARQRRQRREEHIALGRGEDGGHAPVAPGLHQPLVPVQSILQALQGAALQPVEQRGFPGAGGRILQPAGAGGLLQAGHGQFLIQVVGHEAVAANGLRFCVHPFPPAAARLRSVGAV